MSINVLPAITLNETPIMDEILGTVRPAPAQPMPAPAQPSVQPAQPVELPAIKPPPSAPIPIPVEEEEEEEEFYAPPPKQPKQRQLVKLLGLWRAV